MFNFLRKEIEKEWEHRPIYPEEIIDFTRCFFQKFNFKDKKILDAGCGWGTDVAFMAQTAKKVIGIDVEPRETWSKLMKKYSNLRFKTANICNLPFDKETFDVVFIKDVLHHVAKSKHQKALNEIERVIRPKGTIIIIEPNKYNPIFYLHFTKLRHHPHFSGRYFKSLILAKFPKAQFRPLEVHVFPGLCNYPVINKIFRFISGFWKFIWEKAPFLRSFSAYIIAEIQR